MRDNGFGHEKRSEPRLPDSGEVRITVDEPILAEIKGSLVDVSASGFRAAHGHASLSNGQIVRFQHSRARGEARVVWNRITADRIETGFLIV